MAGTSLHVIFSQASHKQVRTNYWRGEVLLFFFLYLEWGSTIKLWGIFKLSKGEKENQTRCK